MSEKLEQMFAKMKQARKALKDPESREELVAAQEQAIEILKSDEFGDFVSLSTIYSKLEK